jgi:hypothetical protein
MTASGPTRRRWPAIALVASLLLNGFLLGMLAVDYLRPHKGFTGERMLRFELRRLDDRLPEEAIARIAAELQPLVPSMDAHLDRLRAIRADIRELAAAPEPDRAAIDERLATLRAESTGIQEEVQRATYDALLKLPSEARAALAEDGRAD